MLCSTAKQQGLQNSIAIDKLQKQGARTSIIRLDLTREADCSLVDGWLDSPLLVWAHLAPVCGTASRARDIRVLPTDPAPLRSCEHPDGLPNLDGRDLLRVRLANKLFDFACKVFAKATERGILVTMENPKNSYFWSTNFFVHLQASFEMHTADFQVCMYGGTRDKWTRFVANFPEVGQLSIVCDKTHSHAPWRFAQDAQGKRVWATSLESEYTRQLCIATVQVVLHKAQSLGLTLLPQSLKDIQTHPLMQNQQSRIAIGKQPFRKKVPPVIPDFDSVIVAVLSDKSQVPFPLLGKVTYELQLLSVELLPLVIPVNSRLLRFFAASEPSARGGSKASEASEDRDQEQAVSRSGADLSQFLFRAVFGLPRNVENFINTARGVGHPALLDMRIPSDLEVAIDKNTSWTVEQISKYRSEWCQRWLKRAKELESDELRDRALHPEHVRHSAQSKRLLVTREILESIGYEDVQTLDILKHGSTLAGSIESCNIFEDQFKPCLLTLKQLEQGAARRNQAILAMAVSSGDEAVDRQVLEETRVELERGWARGPFKPEDLPNDSVISRRFPLVQSNKTRMIDDFSISGVNDSCTIHSKIDLHMIGALGAVIRKYFQRCSGADADSRLWAKTFDLKSAYRQVPIRSEHLRYAFFSIYNPETQGVEIYQLLTLPFGATHSVYAFLRLARMIHTVAARALYVLNTNFYDDFVLLSNPGASKSANLSMEVLFMLTGWEFAKEGKKSTTFGELCSALGVTFDLSKSESRIARIYNTEQRRTDLISKLEEVLKCGELSKHDSLVLRGRLGFADSFLHGRLGGLLLKKLVEHACSRHKALDPCTKQALAAMKLRLELGRLRSRTKR